MPATVPNLLQSAAASLTRIAPRVPPSPVLNDAVTKGTKPKYPKLFLPPFRSAVPWAGGCDPTQPWLLCRAGGVHFQNPLYNYPQLRFDAPK